MTNPVFDTDLKFKDSTGREIKIIDFRINLTFKDFLEGSHESMSSTIRELRNTGKVYDDDGNSIYIYDPKYTPLLPKYMMEAQLECDDAIHSSDPYAFSAVHLFWHRSFVDQPIVEMVKEAFNDLQWEAISDDIILDVDML